MNDTLSEFMQSEMKKRGWSQADLSRRSGLTTGGVSMLIGHTRKPNPDSLNALAKAFACPPEHLFRLAGLLPSEPEESTRVKDIICMLSQLPEEKVQMVYEIVTGFVYMSTRDSADKE